MIQRHEPYAGADQDGGKEEADELCGCGWMGGREKRRGREGEGEGV